MLRELFSVMCLLCSEQNAAEQEPLIVRQAAGTYKLRELDDDFPKVQDSMRGNAFLTASSLVLPVSTALASAPSTFPSSGNGLWYRAPGTTWTREWLPVGNGYLAGISLLFLCRESSW